MPTRNMYKFQGIERVLEFGQLVQNIFKHREIEDDGSEGSGNDLIFAPHNARANLPHASMI